MFEGTLNVLITVQSIYNTHRYNKNLNITRFMLWIPVYYHRILKKKKNVTKGLQKNDQKMVIFQ